MKTLRFAMACAAVATSVLTAGAQLVVNELMQSNIDCILDDLNEFPDSWVELHNTSTTTVQLSDYRISDSADPASAYTLPAKIVAPGAKVLVYCDKVGSGLHTPFRLESGKGGAVYLFRGTECVDKVEGLKKQPAPNVAYGRESDGASKWGYMATPTPGAANCGTCYKTVVGSPTFSVPGRVGNTPVTVALALPADAPEGSKIYYTTDGAEPTASSRLYTSPLNISSTTTLRAVCIAPGCLTPRSAAQSYIFLPRKMTLPVISMVGDTRWFNDSKLGIFAGENYKQDWRRPVNFELFAAPDSPSVINQLCETRIKGGYTRQINPLKSMVLYANKRFGEKRFNYEFFPTDAPGLTDWKSFEIRDSGNDFDYLYFRDALVQRMMGRNADLDWQPWQPAIFMLNGQYKGILNIRPRSNEDHVYTFYDGLEDIDMLENWSELKTGDKVNFDAFRAFYATPGHTYAEFEKWMDTGEYCNLMLMNLFFDNRDFPGNNIVMWRPRTPEGRWRWIAKDCDFGLGLYGNPVTYNTIKWLYDNNYDSNSNWGNTPDATLLFRRLMETPEFFDMFTSRVALYLGDFLAPTSITREIDAMQSVIAAEYPSHRALFNPWWPNWSEEIAAAKRWAEARGGNFLGYVADHYGLTAPASLKVSSTEAATFTINEVTLKPGAAFTGKFYPKRQLRISAELADSTRQVTGWSVITKVRGGSKTVEHPGSTLTIDMPDCLELVVKPVTAVSSLPALPSAEASFDPSAPHQIFTLSGAEVASPTAPGLYLIRQNGHTYKQVVR